MDNDCLVPVDKHGNDGSVKILPQSFDPTYEVKDQIF